MKKESLLAKKLKASRTLMRLKQEGFSDFLNISKDTYQTYEQSRNCPRINSRHAKSFISKLRWTREEMAEIHADWECYFLASKQKEYYVRSFGELMGDGLDVKTLGKDLEKILEKFPLPLIKDGGNDMGSIEKWGQMYRVSPDTGYAILNSQGRIVGYWFFVCVTEEVYEQILNGENVNEKIDTSDVIVLDMEGDYDAYFVDFFLMDNYNTPQTRTALFGKLFEYTESLAKSKIFIRRVIANITSNSAKNLCVRRGFNYIVDHSFHRIYGDDGSIVPSKIYELNLKESIERNCFGSNDRLKLLYKIHFNLR